ncbi:MAG: prepilin-type N-terminal cleavage/methylation domain-containing protein [Patescibacteria group bacterium]|nr:prepilin-type N-terminal cleavage/methylation domain-containing protein [Patescibacteria group bacterium]
MKKLMPKLKGFTIIEVIIVLVIGAVIMLAVFLVVPQLQRTQRNSSRQNAARRVFTAGEQYAASTNVYPQANGSAVSIPPQNCIGTLNTGCKPITDITGEVKSPSGVFYTVKGSIDPAGTWTTSIDFMAVLYLATQNCDNNTTISNPTGTINKFVVVVRLETSGDPTNWCVSN